MSDEAVVLRRRCQRVIRMVSELHRLGYQQLRIMPYGHEPHWRLAIGPRVLFLKENGAVVPDGSAGRGQVVTYTSASGNTFFDWKDARSDNARTLAEKFIVRFGAVARLGAGRDWKYSGWLSELIGVLEREKRLPFLPPRSLLPPFDQLQQLPLRDYITGTGDRYFDLPPPGELELVKEEPAKDLFG